MIPGYLNVQEVASIPYKRLILKTMFMSMKLYDCLKVVEWAIQNTEIYVKFLWMGEQRMSRTVEVKAKSFSV